MSVWQEQNNDLIARLRGWVFCEGVIIFFFIIWIIRLYMKLALR